MVKVLIVEDSRVVSQYLEYIFSQDPGIKVIGNVRNGKEAVAFIKNQKPDVVSMDIEMPVMNGLEATRILMSSTPLPILIVTASRNSNEVAISMEALAAGALAVVQKPAGIGHPAQEKIAHDLVRMIKLMAEVKVVSRRFKKLPPPKQTHIKQFVRIPDEAIAKTKLVAIGVSSGGPQTLKIVFNNITENFPIPIVVVQHIAEGFINGLVNWLNSQVAIHFQVAENGMKLKPGNVYFAPDNYQMGVTAGGSIALAECNGEKVLCPSIAHLFTSVAKTYKASSLGIILTGMGSDGAKELKLMRDAGAITIAQDKKSSLIHGMPGVAVKYGSAEYVMASSEINQLLVEFESIKKASKT